MIPLRTMAIAASLMAAFTAGVFLKGRADAANIARIQGEMQAMRAAYAEEKRQQAESAALAIAAAQKAADDAASRAARLQTRLEEEKNRVKTALYGLSDRPCLGSDALGLLEHSPGIAMSAPAGKPAGAPSSASASAGDEPHVSERDLALWINDASALYETCRARIDALRQWGEKLDGR